MLYIFLVLSDVHVADAQVPCLPLDAILSSWLIVYLLIHSRMISRKAREKSLATDQPIAWMYATTAAVVSASRLTPRMYG